MNAMNDNRIAAGTGEISAHQRLRKAARALEQAVVLQREQVRELQDNMTALDRSLDNVEDAFRQAHDRLRPADDPDPAPAAI